MCIRVRANVNVTGGSGTVIEGGEQCCCGSLQCHNPGSPTTSGTTRLAKCGPRDGESLNVTGAAGAKSEVRVSLDGLPSLQGGGSDCMTRPSNVYSGPKSCVDLVIYYM